MPEYQYSARSHQGEAIKGVMDAHSSDAVASHLMESGLIPVDIHIATASIGRYKNSKTKLAKRLRPGDLIQFSRQMHSLTKAGVPILSALSGLQHSTHNVVIQETVGALLRSLQSGRDLATACGEHPRIFSMFYVSMIRIGETTGQLDEIFLQLSRYLDRDEKTKKRIKSAVRYPVFVLAAILIALVVINVFVIPVFAQIFAKYQAELPLMTRALLACSNLFVHYWPLLLLGMTATVVGIIHALRYEHVRLLWDRYQLRLPIIGGLIHRSVMAKFARLFSMASRAGVPVMTALTVVAKALDNRYVEQAVLKMRSGLERGDSITRTALQTGLFDSLVTQMMAVGEESGALDSLLTEVADYYDSELEYEIERMSASIEPLLTIIISSMVLVLALGVFLPMWNIAGAAMNR